MAKHYYGVYGTSWEDEQGNLWYRVYGDKTHHDTLWTIAEKYYGKGSDYTKIWNLNRDSIKDPHWIYPNQVILLKKGNKPVESKKPEPPQDTRPANPPPPPPKVPPKWSDGEFMEDKPVINISKDEYVIGVYDTDIKSTTYQKANAFIITPQLENKNIRELSLSVNEDHPTLNSDAYGSAVIPGTEVSSVITSTEYYISYGQDWIPILPTNISRIKNEYLFVSNGVATLRFKADVTQDTYKTQLYKNGIKVSNEDGSWFFLPDKQQVNIVNYDSSADYTMDYVPYKDEQTDPSKVLLTDATLNSMLKTVTEVFSDGTDMNMKLTLSQIPYVDNNIVNSDGFNPNQCFLDVVNGTNNYPVSVIVDQSDFVDNTGAIVPIITQDVTDGENIHLKNITMYRDKEVPTLNIFDANTYPYIEFYHLGRNIYFPERFKYGNDLDNIKSGAHGNGRISVSYKYPDVNVKVKVICRRTTDLYDKYVTPTITSIKVDAKVIK